MRHIHQSLALLFILVGLISCKKFLDLKPDKKLTVPSSLKDLQALLDNKNIMNQNSPSYDEASSDNYFLPMSSYLRMSLNQRNAYIWENYEYNYSNDWAAIYKVIYLANEVVHNLKNISRTPLNGVEWDNVYGSALAYRSGAFLKAVWIFSKAFDEQTSDTDLGIVLRTDPDLNQKSVRANVRQSYDQIINDLKNAASLLPDHPVTVMRPSKQSAYALLARTYLSMNKYDSAFKYSNLCLGINDTLLDYNLENVDDLLFPFRPLNKEIVFCESIGIMNYRISPGEALVDSLLYQSYNNNDLRKRAFYLDASLFFPDLNGFLFKGTYMGDFGTLFTGITTAEMYLTRSECFARLGNLENALLDLNHLLRNRYKTGTFSNVDAATIDEALQEIKSERRKELVFRGLRWMDIKRFNKEGHNIILKRNVNGQTYTLQPNENRYALPIPDDVVKNSGIPQNPK